MSADPLWMQTYTGRAFRFPPTADMVQMEDIAHALSMQCRYNGHCRRFYSVAEHSVLVADWLHAEYGDAHLALAGLLHDAAEAYVCDVPRPLRPRLSAYGALEAQVETVIAEKYSVDQHDPRIKDADFRILTDEKAALMANEPEAWHLHPAGALGVAIRCWGPNEAKAAFMRRFVEFWCDGDGDEEVPE